MIVRARYLVAAAVGLCAAHLLPAQEPARLGLERNSLPAPRSTNQQLADAVARQLRQGGQLRDYRIDIVCREGLVELSGTVTGQAQRDEALRLVQGVPGVERVLDRLTLPSDAAVQQTQAGAPPATAVTLGQRLKTSGCVVSGGLPDRACTPGAIFPDVTRDQICRPGYASSVRDV